MAAPLIFILKIALVAGPANQNSEQGDKGFQVKNRGEKKPVQKSYKGQKTAKSKKWIRAKKAEVSRAKNLDQSGTFLTTDARRAFI